MELNKPTGLDGLTVEFHQIKRVGSIHHFYHIFGKSMIASTMSILNIHRVKKEKKEEKKEYSN